MVVSGEVTLRYGSHPDFGSIEDIWVVGLCVNVIVYQRIIQA